MAFALDPTSASDDIFRPAICARHSCPQAVYRKSCTGESGRDCCPVRALDPAVRSEASVHPKLPWP